MGRKSKFTSKQKIEACEKYIKGQGTLCSISDELGITCQSFRRWLLKYKNNGKDCFEESNTNNSYSSEFKMKVIKEYLEGKESFVDIAAKYNITDSMVINWVNKYNNGEEIKDYDPKSEVYSMKSRKTTLEERIEIVKYALDNNNDYKGAADKFLVPYANVYKWVKIYNEQGEEGLKFHRGRPKNFNTELTELEKKDLEIAKLKLELEKHKRAEEILKKKLGNKETVVQRFSQVRNISDYLTIDYFYNEKKYKIAEICDVLDVNRSSYYKWKSSTQSSKEIQDELLASQILEYHESFDGILGYRRMTEYINHFNKTNYSWKYIRRIMRKLGIKARIRQKKSNYKKVKPEQVGENILARDFNADYPNQKWLTDITEFKISGTKQKLYLSAILDLFDNSIIAYKISTFNNNQLVFDTFDLAIEKYPFARPIFHSDRGFQYTSKIFKCKLDEAGMIQSMSRVGKCIDNGPMEAFWGTLKSEMFYGIKFDDLDSLKNKIEEYINFYNNFRLQSKLKGMAPLEYRHHSSCNYIYF